MTANTTKLAGCIERRHNRETWTMTALFVAAEQEIDAGEDDKYAVVCDDHGSVISCDTVVMGKYLRSHPTEWCEGCQEMTPSDRREKAREVWK